MNGLHRSAVEPAERHDSMSIDPDFMNGQELPTLEQVERVRWRECTVSRLAHFKGNKTLTAKSLGICTKTLYLKLDRYGIVAPDFRKERVVSRAEAYASKLDENKRIKAEAQKIAKERIRRRVSKALRELIDAPLVTVVPMGQKDRRVMAKPRTSKKGKARRQPSYQPMARWLEMRL